MLTTGRPGLPRSFIRRWILVGAAVITFAFGYKFNFRPALCSNNIALNLSAIRRCLMSFKDRIYFFNGTAYDFYSIDELNGRSGPSLQWQSFPLLTEHFPANMTVWMPRQNPQSLAMSIHFSMPLSTTGLAFVDRIYITSVPNLIDRQANLLRMFAQYNITNYEWRFNWTKRTCKDPANKQEVYSKLNLLPGSLVDNMSKRQCSLTMKHVDIWYDIVARNASLALILEDDAVFVPFFREKFDRSILTAIRTGALKIGGLARCVTRENKMHLLSNSTEWIEQDPVIVIGSCLHLNDPSFAKDRKDAQPIFSTHKASASRCSHAYLLTACSARALLKQISVQKNKFWQSDFLLNMQVAASPTLQGFWLDPPIVYQGNQIQDLDGISSFGRKTY